jgi:hypothetical protein
MSNIQKTLDSLQPYVIGIRYLEGKIPVVDAVFKEGWSILEDPKIEKAKGDESLNYYMIYSEKPGVGLDDLLTYVERVIKANQDREKKHDLLKAKVNELKELFKKHSLNKLTTLKFTFKEEELVPNLNDFDVDIDEPLAPPVAPPVAPPSEQHFEEETIPNQPPQPETYLDENKQPIELTEEEMEILEEERRAERNRQAMANKQPAKPKPANNMAKKVELPPRRKPEMAIADRDTDTDCDCGPNEACEKCIDSKGY